MAGFPFVVRLGAYSLYPGIASGWSEEELGDYLHEQKYVVSKYEVMPGDSKQQSSNVDELFIVLDGKVGFACEHQEPVVLATSDGITLPAGEQYLYRNDDSRIARMFVCSRR